MTYYVEVYAEIECLQFVISWNNINFLLQVSNWRRVDKYKLLMATIWPMKFGDKLTRSTSWQVIHRYTQVLIGTCDMHP